MDPLEAAQRIMVDTEGTGKLSQGDAAIDEKATGRRRGHVYSEWDLDKSHIHKKTQRGMDRADTEATTPLSRENTACGVITSLTLAGATKKS